MNVDIYYNHNGSGKVWAINDAETFVVSNKLVGEMVERVITPDDVALEKMYAKKESEGYKKLITIWVFEPSDAARTVKLVRDIYFKNVASAIEMLPERFYRPVIEQVAKKGFGLHEGVIQSRDWLAANPISSVIIPMAAIALVGGQSRYF